MKEPYFQCGYIPIEESATVTSKGQVTILKGIRDTLGIDEGTTVTFEIHDVRTVTVSPQNDSWELHFVCKIKLETNDSAGEEVAGIDLGIKNLATVAFPDEYVLYPGNSIKQDKHYYNRAEYDTDEENSPSETSMWARRKLATRETHFYHILTETIITECVERGVGTLPVYPANRGAICATPAFTPGRMSLASRGLYTVVYRHDPSYNFQTIVYL